ncbi:uncharacterized protein LOC134479124 [Rattus norvegicus]|uniref:uncharacterized protein LOC134479124 n=1 Tax=Rattus norvegicus TaxID=10116 RepID=UPI00081024DE|eukprot:XP_017450028.1 PREDICTED: vegetative cell wall protein gp1-like [Rattus norvegicus]
MKIKPNVSTDPANAPPPPTPPSTSGKGFPSSEDLETSGNRRQRPLSAAGGRPGAAGRVPSRGATWSPTFPSRILDPQQPTPPTCCAEGETRHAAVSPHVPSAFAAGTLTPSTGSHPGRVLSLRTAPTPVPRHPAPAAPPQPLSTPPSASSPRLPACLQRRPGLTPVPAVPRYGLRDSTAAPGSPPATGAGRAGGADSTAGAAIGSGRPLPRPGWPAARRARERILWQA